jgi:hypothetical protein
MTIYTPKTPVTHLLPDRQLPMDTLLATDKLPRKKAMNTAFNNQVATKK